MTRYAEAFWVAAPGRGEIRREPLRAPGDSEVLVRSLFSGISRGTEALVFNGRVPPSEYARMRAPFQQGDFPAPVKYGYASVGVIADGPPSLTGRYAFLLEPHQTWYVAPLDAVHLIPTGTPPERAVLAANMETAINVLWDAQAQLGDRIAIVGGGTVGCLAAWLAARIPGCAVELIDVNLSRARIAETLGVPFAAPGQATPDADVVVHASGAPNGLATALDLAAFEATVVEASWYGDASVTLPLGGGFHARRLTIRSSQVGHVATRQRARWDTKRRMALALSLLADPVLDVLITGESMFEDLPEVMARLAASPGDTLCHRIRYGETHV
ncbi:MAG: zinc-binding alcohol dehydrogenase [Vicinamibacterales bacterium]